MWRRNNAHAQYTPTVRNNRFAVLFSCLLVAFFSFLSDIPDEVETHVFGGSAPGLALVGAAFPNIHASQRHTVVCAPTRTTIFCSHRWWRRVCMFCVYVSCE